MFGASLAGLRNAPILERAAPPALCDSISSERILDHIIMLSRQSTRASSSRGADFAVSYIEGCLRDAGWDVEIERFDIAERPGVAAVTNIEATFPPGSGADSVLILCTHYDSRADDPGGHAPGADDNASGTAVLLETARALSAAGAPHGSIRVKMLFFGGEEDSMLGSTRYVKRLAAGSQTVIGVVNIDMVGYDREGPKDFVIFTNQASAGLARYIETCAGLASVLRYETTTTGYANSDHSPFWSEGFRAVSIWEGYDHNPFYHSAFDTPDTLSPSFMSALARVLLCSILRMQPGSPAPVFR